MDKRWQLSFDEGATYADCRPLNAGGLSIDQSRDLDKGQIFFRDAISGAIKFGGDDYASINEWRRQPPLRCQPIRIRLQLRCGGIWQTRWTGSFAASGGKWDLSNCTVEVKPETVDRYSCLLEASKVNINLLQAEKVTSTVIVLPSLEFASCFITGGYPVGCEEYQTNAWTIGAQATLPGCPDDPADTYAYVFWRERVTTECVGGDPVSPSGVGWTLLTNECDTNGTATYVRPPTIAWTFGDPVIGFFVDGVPVPPDNDCFYVSAGTVEGNYLCGPYAIFVCLNDAESETITGSRKLESAINFMLSALGCGAVTVRSDLFYWNPQGSAPGFVDGLDYVTGRATQVDQLLLTQKTDFVTTLPTNPATIGEITFEDMMKALNVMFQVFWNIDDDGSLRIEHWIYWQGQDGLDLSTAKEVNERLVYENLSENIPRVERVTFMESQSRDFVGRDIVYSGPCVSQNEAKEYTTGKVTTDVSFVLAEPSAISRDGFVFTATSYNGSTYDTIIDTGAITGQFLSNAPLSTANLERDYWTWNRYLKTGEMNGRYTVFDGYMPNVEQDPVTFLLCCEALAFDPLKTIAGDLSAQLGTRGVVESTSWSLKSNRLEAVLRYAY